MNKLRLSTSMMLHADFTDDVSAFIRRGLDFHKKMGFDAVDFPEFLFRQMGDDWERLLTEAMEEAQKTGIGFELCHMPYSTRIGIDREFTEIFNAEMHRAIDAAKFLGVDYAVLHPNTVTASLDTFNRRAEYDSVMSHLSPFVEHADRIGLDLVVENMRIVPGKVTVHRYCQDPDELCDIADALGIGVCWDFGHANINGLKQSEALHYIGSRLKVLHVNDNLGVDDIHLPPFIGNLDWEDAMKGLAAVNFNGLFNYEIAVRGKPVGVREAFAAYLVDAAQELMGLME